MKRLLILLFALPVYGFLQAQSFTRPRVDSAVSAISKHSGISNQKRMAGDLLTRLQKDTALYNYAAAEIIRLAGSSGNKDLICQVVYTTALYKYFSNKKEEAIPLLDSVVRMAKRGNFEESLMASLMARGAMYYARQDYYRSLSDYMAAEKIMIKLRSNRIGSLYSNISMIYNSIEDIDQAEKYLLKALPFISQSKEKESLVKYYNNMGLIQKKKKNYRAADSLYEAGLKIAIENNLQRDISDLLYNRANVLTHQGKTKEALEIRLRLLGIVEKDDQPDWLKLLCVNIAEDYFNLGMKTEAARFLNRSVSIAWSADGFEAQKYDYYDGEGGLNFKIGKFAEAARSYSLAAAAVAEEQSRNSHINLEQVKYNFQKQQDSLSFAKQQEIERLRNEKQRQETEHKLSRQRIFTSISVFVLAAIGVFSVFLLRVNRQKDAANKELKEQKLLVSEKNKEITDSISYSLRIQQSLLPSQRKLNHYLPDHFLIYIPKDIVSGDFYWIHECGNEEFLLAVGDCTGHGVPGAIMSALSVQQLNGMARKATEPSVILKRLNKKLKESLKQGEDGASRDGLDIALCRINLKERTLVYSGANRNLWIFDNNGLKKEIKATKAGIAGYTSDEQQYEQHHLRFGEGEVVVLSTDGFADQFGGPESKRGAKKITTRRFKEWIAEHADKELQAGGNELLERFLKWKNNSEQIDDVCVLGFKFV